MAKRILILSGSPKKDGNTAALVDWFVEGARWRGYRSCPHRVFEI